MQLQFLLMTLNLIMKMSWLGVYTISKHLSRQINWSRSKVRSGSSRSTQFLTRYRSLTVEDVTKNLKTLENPKESMVKKRCLMKMKFGNYRQQMETERRNISLGN